MHNALPISAHNQALNPARNQAHSGRAALRENGRIAGAQRACSRLVARNTAGLSEALGPGSAGRQTLRLAQPQGSGTRPVSGWSEPLAGRAIRVVPCPLLAMAVAAEAAQQQRDPVRSVLRIAGQGRQAGGSMTGRRGSEAVQASLALWQGGQGVCARSMTVGIRRGSQAIDRQGEGHVGGRGSGGNVSSTLSGGRRGDQLGGRGYVARGSTEDTGGTISSTREGSEQWAQEQRPGRQRPAWRKPFSHAAWARGATGGSRSPPGTVPAAVSVP